MNTGTSVAWPKGGTPPMEYPVADLTTSAPAFSTGSPAAAPRSRSSRRLAPLTSATTGRPAATNTSDLTIWPTSHPTACAASTAVRVPAGNCFTETPIPESRSQSSNREVSRDTTKR